MAPNPEAIEARRQRRERDRREIELAEQTRRQHDRDIARKPVASKQRWRMGRTPGSYRSRR